MISVFSSVWDATRWRRRLWVPFLLMGGLVLGRAAETPPATEVKPFELLEGDRVVMVGDTLIERERAYGYIELALTTRFPARPVTFRNLGWSGDTPQGQARVGFDHSKPAEVWFQQLTNSIALLRPTVVL